jgi:membrane protein YdbS with pleckstrin-like domain
MEVTVAANPVLDLSGVPRLEEVEFHAVSRKYLRLRLGVWGGAQLLILAAAVAPAVAHVLTEDPEWAMLSQWWWPVGVQSVFALLWFLEEWKGFPRRGYAIRERDITYRTGWLFRTTTTVPFGMIQHSELVQGPVSRLLQIKNLRLFTAGGSGNLRIAGLDEEQAETLRAILETRTRKV